MKKLKGVDSETGRQLFICGQIMGIQLRQKQRLEVEPGALEAMLDQVKIHILKKYLDSKPEGFKYSKECYEIIRMVREREDNTSAGMAE
jgi:hypothetical protein